MNYVIYTLLLLILPLEFLFPANLKWSAETRLRVQNLHNDTTSTSSTASYFRGRINFDLTSNIYKAYFQLQDSRLLGNQNNYAGQTGLDNSYPTFHQFYGQVSGPFNGKNRIRFGRFEMPLGNQRIFGRSNWGNYGRSFEGITNSRNTRQGEILFFHLVNTDLYPMNDQFDYVIDGFYATSNIQTLRNRGTQSIESEKTKNPDSGVLFDYYLFNENIVVSPGENTKKRQTLGARIDKKFTRFSIEAEGAYQTGKYYSDNIEAYLLSLNLEFPINFIPFTKSISFSQEYISGDKYHLGGSDGVLSGFAKPFGAGHKFHGYYDNPLHKKFANNSHAGLNEWFIKTKHEIFPDLNIVVKYHSFKDAIDVNTYGQELDFVLSKKLPLGGKIVQGYSAYFTEDGDRLDFGYFMLVFNI
tara:strand:- start:1547 stop:2785 length:1239 start_codon:yes stop_codon:yes gene_type:complete